MEPSALNTLTLLVFSVSLICVPGLNNGIDRGLLNDLHFLAGFQVDEIVGVQTQEHAVIHCGSDALGAGILVQQELLGTNGENDL